MQSLRVLFNLPPGSVLRDKNLEYVISNNTRFYFTYIEQDKNKIRVFDDMDENKWLEQEFVLLRLESEA